MTIAKLTQDVLGWSDKNAKNFCSFK